MNAKALRQLALDTKDIKTAPVTSTVWPGFTATARSLTLDAKLEAVRSVTDDEGVVDNKKLIPVMVTLSLHDEDGHRIFEDGDAEALGQKSAAAMEEIWTVVAPLNGMGEEAVVVAEKNSEPSPTSSSASS